MVSRKPEMYLRHRRGVLPLLYGPNGPTWVGSLLPVLLVMPFGILVNYRSPIPGQGRGVVSGNSIDVYNVIRVLFYNVFSGTNNTYNAY